MSTPTAEWFAWQPSTGNLTITLPGSVTIASLYLDQYAEPVTVYVGSTVVWISTAAIPQTIQLPAGTTSVTLTATSSTNFVYVFASNAVLPPSYPSGSTFTAYSGIVNSIPTYGVSTLITYPTAFAVQTTSVSLTAFGLAGDQLEAKLDSANPPTRFGFHVIVTGGSSPATTSISWAATGQ